MDSSFTRCYWIMQSAVLYWNSIMMTHHMQSISVLRYRLVLVDCKAQDKKNRTMLAISVPGCTWMMMVSNVSIFS